MARLVVLLRGVNLVSRNRVSMPALRDALVEAGFEGVATYVQSGNVVLTTRRPPPDVRDAVGELLRDRFALDIGVVVRTRAELAAIVERDPLAAVATDPKRYQVTFLDGEPDAAALAKLEAASVAGEELVRHGLELYTWHPSGMGRSKLARLLSDRALGVTATSRNWTTVRALLALAGEE